jgi:hypothetical protein
LLPDFRRTGITYQYNGFAGVLFRLDKNTRADDSDQAQSAADSVRRKA